MLSALGCFFKPKVHPTETAHLPTSPPALPHGTLATMHASDHAACAGEASPRPPLSAFKDHVGQLDAKVAHASADRIKTGFRRVRENVATRQMVGEGSAWKERGLPVEGNAIRNLSKANMSALRKELAKPSAGKNEPTRLSDQEKEFLERGFAQHFAVTHATRADLTTPRGDLHIKSRLELEKSGVSFPNTNTSGVDIWKLGSEGHVFFSLEAGPTLSKPTSRFGSNIYRADLAAPAFAHANLGLNDPLSYIHPNASKHITGMSIRDSKILQRYRHVDTASDTFHGQDMVPGVLLSVVKASRTPRLSQQGRDAVLNARTPEEFNGVINGLFRPEIRVPKTFNCPAGEFAHFTRPTQVSHPGHFIVASIIGSSGLSVGGVETP